MLAVAAQRALVYSLLELRVDAFGGSGRCEARSQLWVVCWRMLVAPRRVHGSFLRPVRFAGVLASLLRGSSA